MTINARQRLVGFARDFVEQKLCGYLRWDEVKIADAVPAEPDKKTGRKPRHNQKKEIVTISFGDYQIEILSPEENGPLGWITMRTSESDLLEGPLDVQIWSVIGEFIKKRGIKEHAHVGTELESILRGEWGSSR